MPSSPGSATTSSSGPPRAEAGGTRVGRDGALRLGFERRGGRTVVARAGYRLPLQVLAPVALEDPAAVVSVLNPTGGLVGGDRLAIAVEAGPGAHAVLTTPSANRVYRTTGPPAVQEIRLRLGAGAVVEWVPDHTIPYAGSAFHQALDAELDDGAALVLVDAFAAGRVARGEAWGFAGLESAVHVRDRGGPVLHDRFVLGPASGAAGLGFAEGHPYFATLVVVADRGLDAFAAAAERALDGIAGVRGGVARLPRRGVLVRALAEDAPALEAALLALWAEARGRVLGLPPLALRKP